MRSFLTKTAPGQLAQFPLDEEYHHYQGITGIDEVGRGCLAGPVVTAAVTWDPKIQSQRKWFPAVADSKLLSAKVRNQLFPHIVHRAARVRVAVINHVLVDYLNVLRATLHGFQMVAPPFREEVPLLIDGNQRPADLKWGKTVVGGDHKCSAIAAAGIVAKVVRDQLVKRLDQEFPVYGFGQHKGYATKFHKQAIGRWGACPYHRLSFRPMSERNAVDDQWESTLKTAVSTADAASLPNLWRRFCLHYQRMSLAGARNTVAAFQRAGFAVLPGPGEPRLGSNHT